jgi:hypothetical protein
VVQHHIIIYPRQRTGSPKAADHSLELRTGAWQDRRFGFGAAVRVGATRGAVDLRDRRHHVLDDPAMIGT